MCNPEDLFKYTDEELSCLKRKDKRLAAVIELVGRVERKVIPDLFAALVNSIVGQQISTKAHETIWGKMQSALGKITPESIAALGDEELQRFGITFKKVAYIKSAARKVLSGELDIESLRSMPDDEVCAKLVELDGIGIWTAEMLLIFSMQRRDVLSYDDLAIRRGMRMVYRHREITRELFARYRKRLSPYASIASLYFWAVAGGAVEGMKDYAPQKKETNGKGGKTDRSQKQGPKIPR